VQAVNYHQFKYWLPAEPKPNPKDPHATDPNRSKDGTYGPGNSGDGKAAEKAALDDLERKTHVPIIRQQVRATQPDVIDPVTKKPQGRFFDGLQPTGNPDEYIGIEVKTNPGALRPNQERFDNAVSPDRPATATLNGRPIKIIDTRTVYPPEGWVPPSAQVTQTVPPAGAAPGDAGGLPPPPVLRRDDGAPLVPGPGSEPFPNRGTHVSPDEAAKGGGEIGNLGKFLEGFLPHDPHDPNNTA
jgi:hypothetical protein